MKSSQSFLTLSVIGTVLSIVFVLTSQTGNLEGCVNASGTVYIDQTPLSDADIFLVPVAVSAKTKSYRGHSNSSGEYEVSGGLPPGEYRVVVRCLVVAPSASGGVTYQPGEIDEGQMAAMMSAAEMRSQKQQQQTSRTQTASVNSIVPESYGSAQLTSLRVTIPESGSSNADLHLIGASSSRLASGDSNGGSLR